LWISIVLNADPDPDPTLQKNDDPGPDLDHTPTFALVEKSEFLFLFYSQQYVMVVWPNPQH
jgi:hypothetical protein